MSEHKVDFADIKAKVSIVQVAEMLGLSLAEVQATVKGEQTTQLTGTCPISGGTQARAFKITPTRNAFICWCSECKKREKAGGDAIELVARMRRCGHREAAQLISSHFGLEGQNGAGKPAENAPAPSKATEQGRNSDAFDPRKYLETLDPDHEALAGLGISPDTLRDFHAGYCGKGVNRGRLAVGLCDMDGTILAFVGVAIKGESPQYVMPKGMPLPYWFNNHRVAENGELRIVSSVIEVLQAGDSGCYNVICPLAQTTSDAITSLKSLMDEKALILEF